MKSGPGLKAPRCESVCDRPEGPRSLLDACLESLQTSVCIQRDNRQCRIKLDATS